MREFSYKDKKYHTIIVKKVEVNDISNYLDEHPQFFEDYKGYEFFYSKN